MVVFVIIVVVVTCLLSGHFSVSDCADELDYYTIEPTESMLEKCRKIDRCLRVLENVSVCVCVCCQMG